LACFDTIIVIGCEPDDVPGYGLRRDVYDVRFDECVVGQRMAVAILHPVGRRGNSDNYGCDQEDNENRALGPSRPGRVRGCWWGYCWASGRGGWRRRRRCGTHVFLQGAGFRESCRDRLLQALPRRRLFVNIAPLGVDTPSRADACDDRDRGGGRGYGQEPTG